jgi:hypothetical protein
MQVKPSQATSMLAKFLKAKRVPIVKGSPGIGKSSIARQVAKQFNLKLIDIRLTQCDPCDLVGFPQIIGNKAGYVPMDTFPIEGDSIPTGYNGWLLLFDEISSASPAIQSASYKILLDKMIGNHHLHKNVAMMAAGNLDTDNAIVQPMSTALQSRLVHMELVVDPKGWVDWAADMGIDHRITSYINFKPGNLYTFKPDHTDDTYACPRTWEFTHDILKEVELTDPDCLPMIAGTISEGVAREFISFCKIHADLPKIEQIISNPDAVKVPTEPSILYAMTGCISHHASMDNFGQLMKFLEKFPIEFQVVALRETVRRNNSMMAHASIQKWLDNGANELF